MKKEFLERAKDFFGKNEGINKVYFTSDGNMFRAENYADNWKITLADKAVTPITKEDIFGKSESTGDAPTDSGNADDETGKNNAGGGADEEKKALHKRYIELFDVKPVGLSVEKIKAKIEAKEAELNK